MPPPIFLLTLRKVSVGHLVGEGWGGGARTSPFLVFALVVAFFIWSAPSLLGPLNRAGLGYRLAAEWLEEHDPSRGPIADLTGWVPFYGSRPGFTFANVHEAEASNPFTRYVVVREGHLYGPWGYCAFIRKLVGDRPPTATFPEPARSGAARVLVFDRTGPCEQLKDDQCPLPGDK